MAIVKMLKIPNNDESYSDNNDADVLQKTVSTSDGDSDIIMVPNQSAGVSYTFDVETGAGSGTILVTDSTRAAVIAGSAKWETNAEGVQSVNIHGDTARITAIKCNRVSGTVSLTVTCGSK